MLKINHCTLKNADSFVIAIDTEAKELEFYEIFTNDSNAANVYVQSINYISQLIKCKLYAFKPDKGNV